MQRMQQLATGAFSVMLVTAGIAVADTEQQREPAADRGGRASQPAPHTGSGAPNDPTLDSSSSAARGASSASATPRAGMNRTQIEQVQRELQARGLYSGAIDGQAGAQTMAAVRQFQAQQGLPASGTLDDATRRALGVQLDRQAVSGTQAASGPELDRPVGREGGTPAVNGANPMRSQVQLDRLNRDQLRTLQARLSELGFYQGNVDGVMGDNTRSALRQFFQTQADLASRGIITDATISLFGFSPQGLNPPTSGAQSGNSRAGTSSPPGTQPRGSQPRDGTNSPSGTGMPRSGENPPQPASPTP